MKAAVCTKYGSPEVLRIKEIKKPIPKDSEVLIRVIASTVAAADYRVRSFKVPLAIWLPARLIIGLKKPKQPVLGAELSGVVEAIGKDVTRFQVGAPVLAASLPYFGGYAEYVCLPENTSIIRKPDKVSWEEAAALPIGAKTALFYLRKADIQKGQKILIYGASGSVGTYTIQLAKHFGAEVTAVCSKSNFELVVSLGADKVVDYEKNNWCGDLEEYDIFFVAVDKCPFSIAGKALKNGGAFINISNPLKSPSMLWAKFIKKIKLIAAKDFHQSYADLIYLSGLLEAGKLKPVIDKVFCLEDIVKAHEYVDKGHKKGNVIIKISREYHYFKMMSPSIFSFL